MTTPEPRAHLEPHISPPHAHRPPSPPRSAWQRIRGALRIAGECICVASAVSLLVVWWSVPHVSQWGTHRPTTSAFMEAHRLRRAATPVRYQWRALSDIAPSLRAAVVIAEDANFYTHTGLDYNALWLAAQRNWQHGQLHVGGSTITQQVVKNLYLSPQRSLWRKLREMAITDKLEATLSKSEILELYLNLAQWGDGIYGAEAAARYWFGHSAKHLTAEEAARLASALPNPMRRAPTKSTAKLARRRAHIVAALFASEVISRADRDQAWLALGVRAAPTVKQLLEDDAMGDDTRSNFDDPRSNLEDPRSNLDDTRTNLNVGGPPSARSATVPAPDAAAPTTSETERVAPGTASPAALSPPTAPAPEPAAPAPLP